MGWNYENSVHHKIRKNELDMKILIYVRQKRAKVRFHWMLWNYTRILGLMEDEHISEHDFPQTANEIKFIRSTVPHFRYFQSKNTVAKVKEGHTKYFT